ncbi:MotA/TolQ/ExbB proton channel family protein [Pelagicoccus albus]|uniref:MotA/TolQ/ExbB proton channel family protein n=1 Tax=Pelagicoccus albus TaxID=415222 RepID=A0A7X1B910_9BACT|nr:MotA/TolQ/ExbB proton channel family protein [Pelagicoccus albus]MBC2607569.1 MotA/TolQ/ExbB proton channel family protein [Pelagicoccus albus]
MMKSLVNGIGRLSVFTISCAVVSLVSGQTIDDLAARQQEKLESAIARLEAQREEIFQKQIPLAKTYNDLERQVAESRKAVASARSLRDNNSLSLDELRTAVRETNKQYDYIDRVLFGEFAANFESALSVGEIASDQNAPRTRSLALEADDGDRLAELEANLSMIEAGLERVERIFGGYRYSGEALSSDGRLLEGVFTQVGPMLFFSDDAGSEAGWVEEGEGLRARIAETHSNVAEMVAETSRAGKGMLPLDVTLGNALALEGVEDSIWEHLKKGGVWVVPIVGFAIVSLLVALAKCIQIYKIKATAPVVAHEIARALRLGDKDKAIEIASRQSSPSCEMLLEAVENADESIELVEEVMYEAMLNTQPRLESFLNVIAVTAAIAPLLGLLGTVTGIIKTFKLMNVFGAGDPKPLISGISEALITTELGLVLAIPALIIHALLSRKVAGVLSSMEKLSVAFVNSLSRKVDRRGGPSVGN